MLAANWTEYHVAIQREYKAFRLPNQKAAFRKLFGTCLAGAPCLCPNFSLPIFSRTAVSTFPQPHWLPMGFRGCVERCKVKARCLAQEHNRMTWQPGLKPRLLDLKYSTLTIRPPCLHVRTTNLVTRWKLREAWYLFPDLSQPLHDNAHGRWSQSHWSWYDATFFSFGFFQALSNSHTFGFSCRSMAKRVIAWW